MDPTTKPTAPPAEDAADEIQLPETVNRLLTREEAAHALRLSLRAFCRLIAAGDIEVVKIGKSLRISQRALHRFIEARETRFNPKRRAKEKKQAQELAAAVS